MSQSQLPVSIIMVTNRADERFYDSVSSVQWAAEIIILDSGAKLPIVALKREYHATVYEYKTPITDFAAARNKAVTYATQPWVFFLDSDEVVTPKSTIAIEHVLASNFSAVEVHRVDEFHHHVMTHGEVQDVKLVRLAKKDAITFNRPVHEVATIEGSVGTSDIVLVHQAHTTISEFLVAVSQYSHLEAEFRYAQGKRFSWPRLLLFPIGKAVYSYVFKRGFLDGMAGLTYIVMMSIHSALVSVYLYELQI